MLGLVFALGRRKKYELSRRDREENKPVLKFSAEQDFIKNGSALAARNRFRGANSQTHNSATDEAAGSIADIFQAKQRPYERAEFDVHAFLEERMTDSQSHRSATDEAADSIAGIFQAQ